MKIVSLIDLTLTSSSIPVGYYQLVPVPAWSSVSNYVVGNQIYYAGLTPHYVFKCIQDIAGLVTNPIPSLDASHWELVGTTDRWAMFDDMRGTQSQALTSFSGEVSAAGCDYVGIFGIDAQSVTLTHMFGSEVIKSETIDLRLPLSAPDWWYYFFEDLEFVEQVSWEFPRYGAGSRLLFEFTTSPGAVAKCGVFRPGQEFSVSNTQKGVSSRIVDYSNRASSSLPMIVPGGSGDDIDLTLILPYDSVDYVSRVFRGNAGKPAIYDCNNDGDPPLNSFLLYALFKSFDRVYPDGKFVRCNVSLQGLT